MAGAAGAATGWAGRCGGRGRGRGGLRSGRGLGGRVADLDLVGAGLVNRQAHLAAAVGGLGGRGRPVGVLDVDARAGDGLAGGLEAEPDDVIARVRRLRAVGLARDEGRVDVHGRLALDGHRAAGLDPHLVLRGDGDVRAVEHDGGAARGERDALGDDLAPRVEGGDVGRGRVVDARVGELRHPHLVHLPDGDGVGGADLAAEVLADDHRAVAVGLLALGGDDDLLEIALGADVEALAPGRVVEGELVEAGGAGRFGGRAAAPDGLRAARGEAVRHGVRSAEEAADDHRLVGVALGEGDEHLLPDARERDHPEAGAGPSLADAHPREGVVVVGGLAVPVEVDAHAPELVGVDLLARRADHDGALQPFHARPRDAAGRAHGRGGERGDDAHGAPRAAAAVDVGLEDEQALAGREVGPRRGGEREDGAGCEVDEVGGELDAAAIFPQGGEAALGERVALVLVDARVALGVGDGGVVRLDRGGRHVREAGARRVRVALQPLLARARLLGAVHDREAGAPEVEVGEGDDPRLDLMPDADVGHGGHGLGGPGAARRGRPCGTRWRRRARGRR